MVVAMSSINKPAFGVNPNPAPPSRIPQMLAEGFERIDRAVDEVIFRNGAEYPAASFDVVPVTVVGGGSGGGGNVRASCPGGGGGAVQYTQPVRIETRFQPAEAYLMIDRSLSEDEKANLIQEWKDLWRNELEERENGKQN